jgi:CheY-like chemotaxis protein
LETALPVKPDPLRVARDNSKILVVEDNHVNLLVMETLLAKLGYQVFIAKNGAEAVTFLERQSVDLVLMDCQMPIMDGYEATARIRTSSTTNAKVPIVAVTANVAANDRQRCMEVGMNDYITKPVNQQVLRQKLAIWLDSSAPQP